MSHERDHRLGEFRTLFASAAHRGREDTTYRHAQKRIRCVGAVVDILLQLPTLACWSAPPHEGDRINVDQESGGAAIGGSFGVKHMCLAKGQILSLDSRRVLVEQVAEISRRFVGGGNC